MLRNIISTTRWLARRQINIMSQIALSRCSHIITINHRLDTPDFNIRLYSSNASGPHISEVNQVVFEDICNETLESLCEYFEEIIELAPNLKSADVTYSDGVLTVSLGTSYGTYVINRQTPNKQIWLSSPLSGPKRYDLVLQNGGYWVYKHDGMTLHKLLQNEISKIVENKVEFNKCAHSLL